MRTSLYGIKDRQEKALWITHTHATARYGADPVVVDWLENGVPLQQRMELESTAHMLEDRANIL